ncbi:hypothetical protein LQ063_09580 [Enterococcus hirae]|nr:hypothetical protein [Enterococcus hirae]MCL4596570.1 hypothetical protein [Enterococcus hirae]MCV3108076.1 hypothetical protein [Enterococcus hirae]MCV3110704.1 hypothetical protein [Enterococcus hirae]MDT2624428.1 hypothetical protein [Enterococcus hirae]UQR02983.1 hypothetical protein LQ063_09580 [Enterococcus hirae]
MLSDVEERQQTIVNHLKINQFARITELIDLVNYSETRSCCLRTKWSDP